MNGILDIPQAGELARRALQECKDQHPGELIDVVVIWPGGKTIAEASTAQAGQASRPLVVREISVQAVTERTDYSSIPQDWAQRQTYGIGKSPRLIGAVLRICQAGARSQHDVQVVGVIGLLGIDAEHAMEILAKVIHDNGFILFSDLPRAGAQG